MLFFCGRILLGLFAKDFSLICVFTFFFATTGFGVSVP
jgi:hypothetical protein